MRVTLKRADFYAKAALKAANEGSYETVIRFSIFSPTMAGTHPPTIAAEIEKARSKLLAQHQLSLDLITACYAIRSKLAHANLQDSVDFNLNRHNALTAQEMRLRGFLNAIEASNRGVEDTAEAALSKAAALREKSPGDGFSMRRDDDSVTMRAFNDADADALRKQIKRLVDQRATCNDLLTAANVSGHITLDDATVATLLRADILASE